MSQEILVRGGRIMTERERLIELLEQENAFSRYMTNDERRERLADYLLENGVIVPLYKVGGKGYVIKQSHIEDFKILYVGRGGFVVEFSSNHLLYYDNEEIGECVFFSKAEAEKVLKERESNG